MLHDHLSKSPRATKTGLLFRDEKPGSIPSPAGLVRDSECARACAQQLRAPPPSVASRTPPATA